MKDVLGEPRRKDGERRKEKGQLKGRGFQWFATLGKETEFRR